ncbi:hypothetical protein EVG20_g8101 [Dentipellis fragilis]|uniref:G domain-containing protein n=1 Tax=Dentipellis fragilis TaxID=205917 RepID=A0A4Y9Y888_9AGAM|nr:hypothetical protein EVG20_g8101 [Dentipellis fragilis]
MLTRSPFKSRDDEVITGVMGATGSGKSTFINVASGSNLEVGRGLQSCTSQVQLAPPFYLQGRPVTLIDTPGFDDTNMSDTDVLRAIAVFLAATYERGMKLAGIIYMHRISDVRVGGVSRKNFKLFRELCGTSVLSNVLLVTNMWGAVDPAVGAAREAELSSEDKFFKPVLDKGARLRRHMNTAASAYAILMEFLNGNPAPLRIQRELVVDKKDISQTAAGAVIGRELQKEIKQLRRDAREVRAELQAAEEQEDWYAKEELEQQEQALCKQIDGKENKWRALTQEFERQKGELHEVLDVNAERLRRQAERAEAKHQQELNTLKDELAQEEYIYRQKKTIIEGRINRVKRTQSSAAAELAGDQAEGVQGESAPDSTKARRPFELLRDLENVLKRLEENLRVLEEGFRAFEKDIHAQIRRLEEGHKRNQEQQNGFFANVGWAMDMWFRAVGDGFMRFFGFK